MSNIIESNDFNEEDETIIVTIRLLFKGNQVGTIIGRKGSKITQIREESACEIKVKGNDQDIERIVSVSGSPSGVTRALLKIAEFVEADLNDGLTGRTTKIPVTLNMIVPTSQCGSIIGKSGYRIREIREKTGCNVKIANDLLPNSTEKLITLYGEPRVIEGCVDAICLVMIEEAPRGKCTPYTPATYGPSPVFGMEGMPRNQNFTPNNYFNNGSIRSRNTNNNVQSYNHGGPVSNGHNGGGQSGQGSWNQSNHQSGHPVHMNHSQTFNPTRHPGFQNIYGSPAGPGGLMHPSDPNFVFRDTSLDHFKVKLGMTTNQDGSVEIRVDKDKIGAIMGRGGSRITEIRNRSTQDIKIHEQDENSQIRRITLNGSKDLIDRAILMLHVCVNVYTEPKEKVGHMPLMTALQYGLKDPKHNVPTNHQYPDQNGMISFQGPNFMDYSHGFQPRIPFQPPRSSYNHHLNSKKRNLPEPTMEISNDEEIPSNKREKFRQF